MMVPTGDPASDQIYLDLGFGVTCRASLVGLKGVARRHPDRELLEGRLAKRHLRWRRLAGDVGVGLV